MRQLIYAFIIFIYSISNIVYSTNIDSLITLIPKTKDTNKIDLLNNIVNEIMYSNPNEAIKYANQSFILADSLNNKLRISVCSSNLGLMYNEQGDFINARKYFNISLKNAKILKDSINIAKIYGNIGNSHMYENDYEKALESYLKSLKIFEQLNNDNGKSLIYGTLGNLYLKIEDYDNAIENYKKARDLFIKLGNKGGLATVYMNIGIIYRKDEKRYDEAISLFNKALEIYKIFDYKRGIAQCHANIGEIFIAKKEYKKAIEEFNIAIELFKINKVYDEVILSLINLGDVYTHLNNTDLALGYYMQAYEISKDRNSIKYIEHSSYKIYESYKIKNNFTEALKYHEIYIAFHDSIYDIEKENKFQELLSEFETEKKEKEIEILKKTEQLNTVTIEKNNEKLKLQRIIIIFSVAILIFVLIFVIIILRQNREKKKANIKLKEKNAEINQQNEEITTQRDEIEAQRDKVIQQKEIIELIHDDVSESIEYATRIQQSILPEEKLLSKYVSEHFVLFKPKDKVSGDFYWWANIEGQTVITAADCTGHGVPGAFMSMLGVSFLREIVMKEYITHPGVILRKLRKEVIKALKQKEEIGGQKDGMDMAIISINHETNIVQFSGANNPLYIITERNIQGFKNLEGLVDNSDKLFYEVKPNKMPVSIYYKMDNFTTHEFKLEKGDILYMFSDGYADQFGGEKGRKLKYKAFKKLLIENADKPMIEQKEILNKAFNNWKGDLEQIDDVVVLGVKI